MSLYESYGESSNIARTILGMLEDNKENILKNPKDYHPIIRFYARHLRTFKTKLSVISEDHAFRHYVTPLKSGELLEEFEQLERDSYKFLKQVESEEGLWSDLIR